MVTSWATKFEQCVPGTTRLNISGLDLEIVRIRRPGAAGPFLEDGKFGFSERKGKHQECEPGRKCRAVPELVGK
jgi:hypothetical protein